MALQNKLDRKNRTLAMYGLGVSEDVPPNPEQPKLADGLHLRWGFSPERGFPLYGFYLFRRQHREGTPVSLSSDTGGFLRSLHPGPLSENHLDTPLGEFSSDVNLVLTDDFPPAGSVEFDLQSRKYLRFTLSEDNLARRVKARVGFRKQPGERISDESGDLSFRELPPGVTLGPTENPWKDLPIFRGMQFTALDRTPDNQYTLLPYLMVREREIESDTIAGIDCERALRITLPHACSMIKLEIVTPTSGLPVTVEALGEDGTPIDIKGTTLNNGQPESITIGDSDRAIPFAISEVMVLAGQEPSSEGTSSDRTILSKVTYDIFPPFKLQLTAFWEDMPVAHTALEGRAGEIVSGSLEFDAISAVEIEGGSAALVDLVVVPISEGETDDWEKVPDFLYPMCLPVTHPDYPCTLAQQEDLSKAQELAKGRVKYDTPDKFTSLPGETYAEGTVSVVPGSPIVVGSGTDWSLELEGGTFRIEGDATVYSVIDVVTSEKLVLSRRYVGATGEGKNYGIMIDRHESTQGDFGQLYDHLMNLVAGGSAAGRMMDRFLPAPVYNAGKISPVDETAPTNKLRGNGTSWDNRFEGLALQVIEKTGRAHVEPRSATVTGSGTSWGPDLGGQTFEVVGERTSYTVSTVDPASQKLTLDRPYEGEEAAEKDYTITAARYTVAKVNSATELELDRDYAGPGGQEREYYISAGGFRTEGPEGVTSSTRQYPLETPSMPQQYPLDMVLWGALNPAIAQIVGLYWVDQTADPEVAYDYLIVADYEGRGDLNAEDKAQKILDVLKEEKFAHLDGYIVPGKKVKPPAPPLVAPQGLRVYALPTPKPEASASAGLRWDLNGTGTGELLPEGAILYHLWRATLDDKEPMSAPPAEQYELITKDAPWLVADDQLPQGVSPQRPPNWPPFPMHATDSDITEGWYSYQVSGIDIFGRHSPNSGEGPWYQWGSPPPDPLPWYWESPDDRLVNPFALEVQDRTPPPPPTGIRADVLDPKDPFPLKDAAYDEWFGGLSPAEKDLIGLRVRWLWTPDQMLQAPDLREFRIYYHRGPSGQMNALLGETQSVSLASDTTEESVVETNIVAPDSHPAGAYAGTSLWVGQNSFTVVRSEASSSPGNPLRLHVKNVGKKDTGPLPNSACTLAIPPFYTEGTIWIADGSTTVTGDGTNWTACLEGMPLRVVGEPAEYTVSKVDSPTQLTLDRPYTRGATAQGGTGATVAGSVVTLDGNPDLSGVRPGVDHLFLENDTARPNKVYGITGVNNGDRTVTVDGTPNVGTGPSRWAIVLPQRYDIRHPLYIDYGVPTNWDERYYVVGRDEHVGEHIAPRETPGGRTLRGTGAEVSGSVAALDGNPDLSGVRPGVDHLFLENDTARPNKVYGITEVNKDNKTVTVDGTPNVGTEPSPWRIFWPLLGIRAGVSGSVVTLDGNPDLSGVLPGVDRLLLENDTVRSNKVYVITEVNNDNKAVTVDGTPNIGTGPSPWMIYLPQREYDVFLPATGDTSSEGLPLQPSTEEPIASAHIGVSAADDKDYVPDAPKWYGGRLGNRRGNEGRVGAPAEIFRVLREPPDPPPVPSAGSDKVYATPADYNSRSFYTYRWQPAPGLKTHIFRALDDALFKRDWLIRTTRNNLDPTNTQHQKLFPTDWAPERKQAAASQLNAITSIDSYATLSSDARDILVGLPGNEGATTSGELQQRDWEIRRTRNSLSPDDKSYFPTEWRDDPANTQRRQTIAQGLNAITSFSAYSDLTTKNSNDEMRVLAGLPGNELAFTQLTIQPLDPQELDPDNPSLLKWRNRRGPDDPDSFKLGDPSNPLASEVLRIYTDTLDGLSTNRYFYRSAYVDGAYNRSDLSLSSPPVWLPNIVPPRVPVITKVLGDDRKITLSWASNREPDLAEYRVYRADSEELARDLRLMTLVHTEVADGDPTTRPAEVTWSDSPVPGLVKLFYRLVAVNSTGNVSAPSPIWAARAYDLTPLPPPNWDRLEWVQLDAAGVEHPFTTVPPAGQIWRPAVALAWAVSEQGKTLLERRRDDQTFWQRASAWIAPSALDAGRGVWLYRAYDTEPEPGTSLWYRVRVESPAGNLNTDFDERKLTTP